MHTIPKVLQAIMCVLLLSIAMALAEVTQQSPPEELDFNKLYEVFSSGVATFDEDLDGDLDCLTFVLLDIDKEDKAASYVWQLEKQNGYLNKNFSVDWKPGQAPDEASMKIGDADSPWKSAKVLYTDNKKCIVADFQYNEVHQRILLVTEESKDHIPQSCLDRLEEACGAEKIAYDKGSCTAV